MKTKFVTPYNYSDAHSEKFATEIVGESMTQQSDAQEADINFLMKRYATQGLPEYKFEPGSFADFSDSPDFRKANDILLEAREKFMEVPAEIRKRFQNDPAEFYEFVNNVNNQEELIRMGLAQRKPEPEKEPEWDEINRYAQRQQPRYDDDGEHFDNRGNNGNRSKPGPDSDPDKRPGGGVSNQARGRTGDR